jgi:hypothetical protein
VNEVNSLGAFAIFSGLVLAVTGVSTLALGFSFNYFVALFHKSPVRQGLFGAGGAPVRVETLFGWLGVVALLVGVAFAVVSLALAAWGWTVQQLWLYYLTSACLALVGIQLIIAWVQMEVLDTLRMRDQLVAEDMQGKKQTEAERRDLSVLSTKPA